MKAKTFEMILISLIVSGILMIAAKHITAKEATNYVPYFVDGQILEPDYICTDSMIVIDAKGLNEAYAPIEKGLPGEWDNWGDAQYDSLFHAYCVPFPLK